MKTQAAANPAAAIGGYVRVSTEEQAPEGVSLEAQRAKVVAYCGLHGLELAQTYAARDCRGNAPTTVSPRPRNDATCSQFCTLAFKVFIF